MEIKLRRCQELIENDYLLLKHERKFGILGQLKAESE